MNRKALLTVALFTGIFLLFCRQAPATEYSIDKVIEDSGRHRLCGEFYLDSDSDHKFVFGDKHRLVWFFGEGLEFPTLYFVLDDVLYIKHDKGYFNLTIESPMVLKGKDLFSKGKTYRREKAPEKECLPYVLSPPERLEVEHEVCYVTANNMRLDGKIKEAANQFLECCDKGGMESCNVYGVLKQAFFGDRRVALEYYRKACDGGYGGGCSNLATHEKKSGNIEKAKALLKEACDKGFKRSCMDLILFED
jgi:hypothetical protein